MDNRKSVRGRVLGGALCLGAATLALGLLAGGQPAAVAASDDAAVQTLAVQRVSGLLLNGATSVCLFANDIKQAPGASLYHRHQPGAVYVAGGQVQLTIWQDGLAAGDPGATSETSLLGPGAGAIIPTHWWHQHTNPSGASPDEWYFLSQLPSDESACTNPPSSFIFHSAAIPVADGPALLKLFTTTFAPGDSTAQAGPELAESVVLSGSLVVDGVAYSRGQAFARTPGSVQHMTSTAGARLLTYSVRPQRG